jgi:hypothetical protein
VQGKREADRLLDLVDEPAEARQPADRRHRRPPVRNAEVRQCARRLDHGVEVEHRLAHSHEHGVVGRLDSAEVERLVEDLGRRQVPPEPHLSGGAERAGQRAARLGREAERPAPVAVAHQHGLDGMALVRAEQRLDGPVPRLRLLRELEGRERHVARELVAQSPWEVRHPLVAVGPACGPGPDLPGAICRFSAGSELLR